MSKLIRKKSSRKLYLKYIVLVATISKILASKLPPGSVSATDDYFINPGTRWCGDGNIASAYEDLGSVENVDKCCRDHDHCRLSIPKQTWKYGLYNSDFYTNSDCNCDTEFRSCLWNVTGIESIVAAEVGVGYFTFVKPRCFFAINRVPCEKPYYDEFNNSYKHDGAGKYFCTAWFDNVNWSG